MTTHKEEVQLPKKPTTNVPGTDISTAGFVVAVASIFTNIFTFGLVAIVGLVLSIIGRVHTARAGQPNAYALAGIIISSVVMVLTFALFVLGIVWLFMAPSDAPEYRHGECYGEAQTPWGECRVSEEELLYPRSGT